MVTPLTSAEAREKLADLELLLAKIADGLELPAQTVYGDWDYLFHFTPLSQAEIVNRCGDLYWEASQLLARTKKELGRLALTISETRHD